MSKSLIVAGLMVVTLGAAVFAKDVIQSAKQSTILPPRVAARTAPLEITIRAVGSLVPESEASISQPLPGRLSEVLKEPGETVNKGEVVARVDDSLQQLEITSRQSAIAGYSALIAQRKAALEQSRIKQAAALKLSSSGLTPRAALEQAQTNYTVDKGMLDQAVAQKQQAEAELAKEQIRLELTQIRSPIAGTVLAVSAKAGQLVDPGLGNSNLMTVANTTKLRVEALVTEADVARLAPGIPARVSLTARRDDVRMSRIEKILPLPTKMNGVTLYVVEIPIENLSGQLLVEMTARVDFIIERQNSALIVPSEALGKVDGRPVVALPESTGYRLVNVTTGIANRFSTSILSGLTEGQEILSPFPTQG